MPRGLALFLVHAAFGALLLGGSGAAAAAERSSSGGVAAGRGPAAPSWTPPVPGSPTRLFALGPDPFALGQHRGVDLDAAAGEPVRAACGGRVTFAGTVAGQGTISVRCGPWRVSYAPVERRAARRGARVGPGSRLGRVGRASAGAQGHAGLHFGVRREGRRFGYVDPLPFLAGPRRAPPPVLPVRLPVRLPRPVPRPRPAPQAPRPAPALAPWPVWLGLALLLTGAAGAGTLRSPRQQTGGAACRASSISSSSPTTPSSPRSSSTRPSAGRASRGRARPTGS